MSNVNLLDKPNFVQIIFDLSDKDENRFTEKAQKYQNIILYLFNNDDTSHKITEIQDKVLAKVPLLFKVDNTKKQSEIKKSKNNIFNKYLDNLKNWGLLDSTPAKSKKGGVDTKEYRISKFGKMFAVLIETRLSESKQIAYGKLFDHWKSYWMDYPSSLDVFCMLYIEKCKEKDLFNEFANFYVKSVTDGNNQYIQSINDLFTQMILVKFSDGQKNQILLDLWKKTYHELDEDARQLFTNHMRTHLNKMIVRNIKNYSDYELKRYEKKYSSSYIIAEFCCSCCKSNFKYDAIRVIFYISYAFIQRDYAIESYIKDLKCENCKVNKFHLTMVI